MPRFWSDILLVLHELFDDFEWCSTNGGNEIRICPETGEPCPQRVELFSEVVRGDSFDVLDQSVYPELRVYFDQQVDAVWQDFQRNDFCSIPQSSLMY